MGSSPSKVENGSKEQADKNIKDAKLEAEALIDEPAASYGQDGPQEEKKEMETVSTLSTTPRTKHQTRSSGEEGRRSRQVREGRNDTARQSRIRDDQVHVNLAMADLMAYLQVVANNSNNLPLTRRDDPELSRMVSNLKSEEYARKSAAFIPADVRVIGGSFTKYGRVWDLPNSDEYNAQDGAQEPGKFTSSSAIYCMCVRY